MKWKCRERLSNKSYRTLLINGSQNRCSIIWNANYRLKFQNHRLHCRKKVRSKTKNQSIIDILFQLIKFNWVDHKHRSRWEKRRSNLVKLLGAFFFFVSIFFNETRSFLRDEIKINTNGNVQTPEGFRDSSPDPFKSILNGNAEKPTVKKKRRTGFKWPIEFFFQSNSNSSISGPRIHKLSEEKREKGSAQIFIPCKLIFAGINDHLGSMKHLIHHEIFIEFL